MAGRPTAYAPPAHAQSDQWPRFRSTEHPPCLRAGFLSRLVSRSTRVSGELRAQIARLLGFSLVARLPQGMDPLAVLLLVESRTGSVAGAGAASAAWGLGAALGQVAWSRLSHRSGRRIALGIPQAMQLAALAGLARDTGAAGGCVRNRRRHCSGSVRACAEPAVADDGAGAQRDLRGAVVRRAVRGDRARCSRDPADRGVRQAVCSHPRQWRARRGARRHRLGCSVGLRSVRSRGNRPPDGCGDRAATRSRLTPRQPSPCPAGRGQVPAQA